jgi:hypothetical protein
MAHMPIQTSAPKSSQSGPIFKPFALPNFDLQFNDKNHNMDMAVPLHTVHGSFQLVTGYVLNISIIGTHAPLFLFPAVHWSGK